MDSSIHLSFRYTQQDIVRAMRAHHSWRLRWKLDIAVALAVAMLGGYLYWWGDSPGSGTLLITLSAVLILLLIAAFGFLPYVIFRREPKFRDKYSLTFSSEGIHFRTVHIDSQLQWSMYDRALITAHSFILYYGAGSFSIIPVRVFETREQKAGLESLISQKIPKIIRSGA